MRKSPSGGHYCPQFCTVRKTVQVPGGSHPPSSRWGLYIPQPPPIPIWSAPSLRPSLNFGLAGLLPLKLAIPDKFDRIVSVGDRFQADVGLLACRAVALCNAAGGGSRWATFSCRCRRARGFSPTSIASALSGSASRLISDARLHPLYSARA
jgi:hypothetical protein